MHTRKITITVKSPPDGYSVKNISCRDIAYATAVGAFSSEFYFYYCFFKSVYVNWGSGNHTERTYKALQHVGVSESKYEVTNTSDLLQEVIESLQNNRHCIVALRDRYCYFCEEYKEEHNAFHFVLLTGVDLTKNTVTLMEYMHLRGALSELTDADFMCKFVLPIDTFTSIWEASNQSFVDRPDIMNSLLVLQQDMTPKIKPIELLEVIISSVEHYENDLCRLIREYNNSDHELNEMMEERTTYLGNVHVIFDLIKRYFGNTQLSSFEEKYYSCRDTVLSSLHASVMRNTPLTSTHIESLCKNVSENDSTLLNLLLQVTKMVD